ncbi:MAG: hypothetical protein Q4G45_13865 [Actinomycetia bacterium]|nr:hypothetical protein [Actinomycetes bacterium]
MNEVLVWSGTATAVSSVVHVGDAAGTLALLRRETVVLPDGTLVPVPLVSGNALRVHGAGRLAGPARYSSRTWLVRRAT